jgi:hypothetical protein
MRGAQTLPPLQKGAMGPRPLRLKGFVREERRTTASIYSGNAT